MDLSTIKDSFERVTKKQKLSSSKSQEWIDQIDNELRQTLIHMQSDNNDQKQTLTELNSKLSAIAKNSQDDASQRDLNIIFNKYQKALEKSLNPDISKALRNVDFDPKIVNQIIATHFYRSGQFEIGDSLMEEAGECELKPELVSQFQEIHQILEAVKSRDLDPAIKWASENREKLMKCGSDLELKLHKLNFVDILQNQTQSDALNYAKIHLAPLATNHINEVQRLMGSLLWAKKLENSPYSDLVSPANWETLPKEIWEIFCVLSGQPLEDPLKVVVSAGSEGLPTLLKFANLMGARKQELEAMKQLPVAVELGKEFQFRSVFVCPVSREHGSEENPPMLLPCGHILCKLSIHKLSRGSTRVFKCPYCPMEASGALCKQLYL